MSTFLHTTVYNSRVPHSFTFSVAKMDNVASRKPSPELNVKTTKQMKTIFGRVNSLQKESLEGVASEAENFRHRINSLKTNNYITNGLTM